MNKPSTVTKFDSSFEPLVSVIMPVCDEAAFIERSLGAAIAQDYPTQKMEVLVVDGMSTDDTRAIVEKIASAHQAIAIRVLENPAGIVPTAMNIALSVASGEIIVRIDGHTIIAPDYVRQVVAALARSGADVVGGCMRATASGHFGDAISRATSSRFGIGNSRFHYSNREELVDTVYLGAWPKRVFHKIGLFDEEMVRNQDDEFNYRLLSAGGAILLCPSIRSRYYNRDSVYALWKQYFQYGFWKVRVLQKHPRQMRVRQFVPPLFVLSIIAALFLSAINSDLGGLSLIVAASYGLANLTAALIASRDNPIGLPLVSFAFATIHLAYGAGFILGMLRFMGMWRYQESSAEWDARQVNREPTPKRRVL